MKRIATITSILVLGLAGSASATTIQVADGTPDFPYQRWVDEAKVPTPPIVLPVEENSGLGSAAATPNPALPAEDRESVHIDFDVTRGQYRHTFLHELGHIYAYTSMDDGERAQFSALMGDSRSWHEYTPPYWHASPGELFAEAYAFCAKRGRKVLSTESPFSITGMAPINPITRRELWRECKLISRSAATPRPTAQ